MRPKAKLAILILSIVSIGYVQAHAQHGSAPAGYHYPQGYMGDTWTGVITALDADKREVTLTYTDKKGPHNFVAYIPKHYKVHFENGEEGDLKMTDLQLGQTIRVYYQPKTAKVDNQKIKRNEVIRIQTISP